LLVSPDKRRNYGYTSTVAEEYFPFKTRVRYAETDQMGVVHHSVYLVWFEASRSAFSRAVGLPYTEWERQGVLLMVSEVACRFRKPARYDEEVTVWVRVAEVASRRVVFAYRVSAESGDLLAEGETRHLVVDKALGRPMVLPSPFREALLRRPVSSG
jgi:acyl-CoA thioester hydrolase